MVLHHLGHGGMDGGGGGGMEALYDPLWGKHSFGRIIFVCMIQVRT